MLEYTAHSFREELGGVFFLDLGVSKVFNYIRGNTGNSVGDISVITHRFGRRDAFRKRKAGDPKNTLFVLLLLELQKRNVIGSIRLVDVGDPVRTKVALLHVDVTRIPDEYLAYAKKFPVCINGSVKDISKKTISELVLNRSSTWTGPVIIKSDLNCNGKPELYINQQAIRRSFNPPYPDVKSIANYVVYDSIQQVPEEIFNNSNAVVEKFIPEQDERGFAIRHWLFCGDQGYCKRYISKERIIKGGNVLFSEPVDVPIEIRQQREQLAFDCGKFDFVMYEGKAVLLDANKTPGPIPSNDMHAARSVAMLADGLEALIQQKLLLSQVSDL